MRIILPRALRYAPFSANTGLYWLRSNLRTRYFMNVVLHSFDLMLEWRSHQHVVDMLLIEMVSRMGLHVEILPQRLFAIGQAYHHDPAFMEGMRNETHLPYVFHWSWTSGKDEKLKFARAELAAAPGAAAPSCGRWRLPIWKSGNRSTALAIGR